MKPLLCGLLIAGLFLLKPNFTFSQTVSLTKTVYAPGEKIVVNYSGFPGNSRDWISIADPTSADDKYILWQYTNGNRSGTMEFDGRPSGEYEIRGYYNNEGIIRARLRFRVGNVDQNVSVRTSSPSYKPNEKITVHYSGLPGNGRDWVSIAAAGSADDKYIAWFYTDGKQSGSFDFAGLPEGKYEARAYFNNEGIVRSRYPFTVGRLATGRKICRNELSSFYAGMNSLGLCWGRLGSEPMGPATIADVQLTLPNATAGINAIGCLDFDVTKISNFSSRLPQLTQPQAVNEIEQLIKEIQGSVNRAQITCDKNVNLESLYIAAIHLGAAQGIANTFVCRMIPAAWQANLRSHLSLVQSGLSGFNACIPGVNPSIVSTVPVGAPNAYEPFGTIIGIHMQVLWAVSLSDCCCYCR
jgi:hypothetical protein